MRRIDTRSGNEIRPLNIVPGFQSFAEGSTLIEMGKTRVLCSVSMEENVPHFLRGSSRGWVTAEYAMLPRSTLIRTPRNSNKTGRNQEIQRLIGRSLRAVTNLDALGERSFIVDCDVLQADGGTRTAAVTGGYIALYQTFRNLVKRGVLPFMPLDKKIAAVSVGIVEGEALLDLCYEEDYRAEVDFNVVMTDKKEFVEIQGAAEKKPFSRENVEELLSLAEQGINTIFKIQQDILQSLQ